MAGFGRFLMILRLFEASPAGGAPSWTVPAMASVLGVPTSTLYRTVRELTKAGFLEQAGEAHYRLGPAFIEFERLLRLNDPLLRMGRGVLIDLVRQANMPCIAILARLYNGEVMCVADEKAPGTSFRSSYERGRRMPMTRGATSKIILAHLPSRELRKLIGPRASSAQFRHELRATKRAGHAVTASEIDPGLTGVAAPIVDVDLGIAASLTLVVEEKIVDEPARRRLVLLVVSAASMLAESIRKKPQPPTPAPAPKRARAFRADGKRQRA